MDTSGAIPSGQKPCACVVERCVTPRGELQLQRRGEHYEIVSNGVFLMATYNGESEQLLVTAALAAVRRPRRVLIGGLGVGYSLGAALADPRVEEVTVVEIEERVIAWNDSYLAPFSGHGLRDPRTRVVQADLVAWLRRGIEPDGTFDVICLDIDNGPDWTVAEENGALYDGTGLATLRRRLRPGGAASFWSASAAPWFGERLAREFGAVRVLTVAQERGGPDYVYLASVSAADAPGA